MVAQMRPPSFKAINWRCARNKGTPLLGDIGKNRYVVSSTIDIRISQLQFELSLGRRLGK